MWGATKIMHWLEGNLLLLLSMVRALKDSFPGDWDECLPWILFSYREIPVETLGFSPFELTFGRHVYERWACSNLLGFVMRNR